LAKGRITDRRPRLLWQVGKQTMRNSDAAEECSHSEVRYNGQAHVPLVSAFFRRQASSPSSTKFFEPTRVFSSDDIAVGLCTGERCAQTLRHTQTDRPRYVQHL